MGPHQCPTAGPGPVPGHPRPLRPPGAGPWRVPNGGNSWPGRRQQPRREAWAKCPRFVLTGKLFLRRFHGRDESAAGLSRARCRGRESAAIFPIPCRIPVFSCRRGSRGLRGRSSELSLGRARRVGVPTRKSLSGGAGQGGIRSLLFPGWDPSALGLLLRGLGRLPAAEPPLSVGLAPRSSRRAAEKGSRSSDSRHLLFVCGSQRSALPRSVKEL